MIRGVVLDVDGTLVYSNDAHAQSWVEAFSFFNLDVSFPNVRPFIGMGGDKLIKQLIPDISNNLLNEISNYRTKIFLEKYVQGIKPTDGSRELIGEFLKRKLLFCAATSSRKEEIESILRESKLDDLIVTFLSSDDVEDSKPDPDILTAGLKRLNLSKEEAFSIGDSPYDVEAAKNTGIPIIGMLSGGFTLDNLNGAAYVFKDPAELIFHLDPVLSEFSKN